MIAKRSINRLVKLMPKSNLSQSMGHCFYYCPPEIPMNWEQLKVNHYIVINKI